MYRFVHSLIWQDSEWNMNLSWSKGTAFSFLACFLHTAREKDEKNHKYVLCIRGNIEDRAKFMEQIVEKTRILIEQNGAA